MLTTLALVVLTAGFEPPKLLALDLQPLGAASVAEAQSLTDAMLAVVSKAGTFQVIAQRDISTALSIERQKQLLGCADDGTSCLAEISGALDMRFVLSGTLNKLGNTYQLNLQTFDSKKNQPLGRSLRASKSLDELRLLMPWSVADATATPGPKAPSRLAPTLLMVVGGLGLAAAGVVAFQTETREQAIVRELALAKPSSPLPHTSADYQADSVDIAKQKTSALFLGGLGAALAAAGAVWYFSTPDIANGRLALLPTGTGFALAGSFE